MESPEKTLFLTALVFVAGLSIKTTNAFPHHEMDTEKPGKVEVKVTDIGGRRRRSVDELPDEFDVDLSTDEIHKSFNLTRNFDISDNVPVHLMRNGKVKKYRFDSKQKVAYYFDTESGAAFMAWPKSSGNGKLDIYGTFIAEDNKEYFVQPPKDAQSTYTVSKISEKKATVSDFVSLSANDVQIMQEKVQTREHAKRPTNRDKRQTEVYEIEIFFVLDNAMYQGWRNATERLTGSQSATIEYMTQFTGFLLNAIELRYKTVTNYGYKITCRFAGIYIAETPEAAPFVTDNLYSFGFIADDVLDAFRDWAEVNLTNATYDHAMLFSGYEMGRNDNGVFNSATAGLAYLPSYYISGALSGKLATPAVCGSRRYSINEGGGSSPIMATIAAHELGHNLGSGHDGTSNSCSGGYVMEPSSSVSGDPVEDLRLWIFSSCSQDYFDVYINDLNEFSNRIGQANCMTILNATNADDLDPYVNDTAGQLYDPDFQCELIAGTGSYMFRGYFNGDYSNFCTGMPCSDAANTGSSSLSIPWEGTTCGNGKICEAGSCVVSASGPQPQVDDETCPFGEVPYVPGESLTCRDFLGSDATSYWCYQAVYNGSCCVTCEEIRQNNTAYTDCEYGDKWSNCASLTADLSQCYFENTRTNCCKSCVDKALDIPGCEYGDRSSNCDSFITSDLSQCYIDSTRATCCKSCADRELDIPDCRYGDRLSNCASLPCNDQFAADCCQTCAPSTTSTTTTTTTPTTTTTTPTTTTTTPTTTTTTPTTTTTTPTTTTTTPTTTTTTPTTTTTTPTTTTTTPTTTTTTPTTTTTTPTTTTTTPKTTTTTPTTTTTTPTTTTTTPTTTTTTPTTTTTTPTTTTTTPTTTTTTTTTTPTTTTTTPTTTTTTPTTTTTTPTTTTTTPTTTTTTPTTTTTTPTTTTTTPTTTTTTPTTTTTTPTTTTTTPTTTTTTPTTTTTTPTTTTTTPTTTTTTPTTTTTTPTTTTTTPTTTTTTTPTTTTTTPTTTTTTPTTTTTTPTTITTTTPTTTTTTPTTTTTTPTTTTTTPTTNTPTPTTTTTTPTTTTTTPTTTTTTPTTTTTTTATTPTTTTPTTTTTTPTTTTTTPTTTTTTPTTTTTTPTTTTTTPTTITTTPTTTTTTTTPTTTTTTPTTTTPTTTTTTPTTTTTTPTTTTATTTPTTTSTTAITTTISTTTTATASSAIILRRLILIWVFPINTGNSDLSDSAVQQNIAVVIFIYYQSFLGSRCRGVRIITLRRGSLIIEYEVEYEDTPEVAAQVTQANIDIVDGKENITIFNETVSATSVQINNTIVTNETVGSAQIVCDIFILSNGPCEDSHSCSVQDGTPTCVLEKTQFGLTVLIAVAVSLFVFLIIVSVLICLSIRAYRLQKLKHRPDSLTTDVTGTDEQHWPHTRNIAPYGAIGGRQDIPVGYLPYAGEVIGHNSVEYHSDKHHKHGRDRHNKSQDSQGHRTSHRSDRDRHHKHDKKHSRKHLHNYGYDNPAMAYDQILSASYLSNTSYEHR